MNPKSINPYFKRKFSGEWGFVFCINFESLNHLWVQNKRDFKQKLMKKLRDNKSGPWGINLQFMKSLRDY